MEEKRLGIEDFKKIFEENYEEFISQHRVKPHKRHKCPTEKPTTRSKIIS